jgi:hypothetical protein
MIYELGEVLIVLKAVGLNKFNPPASVSDLSKLKRIFRAGVPDEVVEFYEFANGAQLLSGNLNIWPIEGDGFSLTHGSDELRSHEWPIPKEVILFGDCGGEEVYGYWAPDKRVGRQLCPVVVVGSIFDVGCMDVAASSLKSLILGHSAYHLQPDYPGVLDELGVPRHLRFDNHSLDDSAFAQIMGWADPVLPDPAVDPYLKEMDVTAVEEYVEIMDTRQDS